MAQNNRNPYTRPPNNPYDYGYTYDPNTYAYDPSSYTGNTGIGSGVSPNLKPNNDGNSTDRSTNVGPWAAGYGAQPNNVSVPASTAPSAPQTGPDANGNNWSTANFAGNPDLVRQYFASRGVTPRDTSPDYWARQWNTLVERGRQLNDPTYAFRRLEAADEFLPGQDPRNSPFAGSAGGGASGGGVNTPAVSPFTQQIRQLLLQRLGEASRPVTADDPTIAASVSAARLEGQRGNEQTRRALAERLYAGGLGTMDTNAINQGAIQAEERLATGLGTLRGTLMQRELESRRGLMQNLLNQALASGDAETARAIQVQLANLDATLRREGYGINLAMFGQNQNTLPFQG